MRYLGATIALLALAGVLLIGCGFLLYRSLFDPLPQTPDTSLSQDSQEQEAGEPDGEEPEEPQAQEPQEPEEPAESEEIPNPEESADPEEPAAPQEGDREETGSTAGENQDAGTENAAGTGETGSQESQGTVTVEPGGLVDGMPILVNPTHAIPEGYVPQVTPITGSEYQFDVNAVSYLNQMMGEAYDQGVILYPISAYRSNESQTRNFNQKLEENKASGLSDEEAYALTAKYIAVPGTSEHSLGLAVDLNSLDESFDQTQAFQWLQEHCADYGFILRYPKDKVEITGIAYEPWHYRYVGKEHAKIIMEQGICLEEYLGQVE